MCNCISYYLSWLEIFLKTNSFFCQNCFDLLAMYRKILNFFLTGNLFYYYIIQQCAIKISTSKYFHQWRLRKLLCIVKCMPLSYLIIQSVIVWSSLIILFGLLLWQFWEDSSNIVLPSTIELEHIVQDWQKLRSRGGVVLFLGLNGKSSTMIEHYLLIRPQFTKYTNSLLNRT